MADLNDGDLIPATASPIARYSLPQKIDGTQTHLTRINSGAYQPLFAGSEADMTSEGIIGTSANIKDESRLAYEPLTMSISASPSRKYSVVFRFDAQQLSTHGFKDILIKSGVTITSPLSDTIPTVILIPTSNIAAVTYGSSSIPWGAFGGYNSFRVTFTPVPPRSGLNGLKFVIDLERVIQFNNQSSDLGFNWPPVHTFTLFSFLSIFNTNFINVDKPGYTSSDFIYFDPSLGRNVTYHMNFTLTANIVITETDQTYSESFRVTSADPYSGPLLS